MAIFDRSGFFFLLLTLRFHLFTFRLFFFLRLFLCLNFNIGAYHIISARLIPAISGGTFAPIIDKIDGATSESTPTGWVEAYATSSSFENSFFDDEVNASFMGSISINGTGLVVCSLDGSPDVESIIVSQFP